jgi:hypothetical protein
MLRAEMGEKIRSFKTAAPVLVIGILLMVTAWFLLTACLVCAIALAFPNLAARYVISFLIVGVLYLAVGAIAAVFASKQIKESGMKPERTIRVLKQDQIWLQTEAKTQL